MEAFGLVLTGGGAGGLCAYAGLAAALETQRLTPRAVVGVSAGAIVGALIAARLPAAEIAARLGAMDARTYWPTRWHFARLLLGKWGARSSSDLVATVAGLLEGCRWGEQFMVVLTDLATARRVYQKHPSVDEVAASACIPLVFTPVELGKRVFVDGGVVDNVPIEAARAAYPAIARWLVVSPLRIDERTPNEGRGLDWMIKRLLDTAGSDYPEIGTGAGTEVLRLRVDADLDRPEHWSGSIALAEQLAAAPVAAFARSL